jgi:hypothetical protein
MATTTALAPPGGARVSASPAITSEPNVDDDVRAVYELALDKFRAGASADAVRDELQRHGLEADIAARVVANLIEARRDAIKGAKRSGGLRHIGIGAVVAVIGLAVTLGTHAAASSSGGGKFVVAWGAMLFGAIELVWGLVKLSSAGFVSDDDVVNSFKS